MSLSSIMSTGLSALAANQQALKATSTNVANVNTVGYSRLDVQFISRQASGGLSGVEIEVTRVANAYLAAAEMRGAADQAAAHFGQLDLLVADMKATTTEKIEHRLQVLAAQRLGESQDGLSAVGVDALAPVGEARRLTGQVLLHPRADEAVAAAQVVIQKREGLALGYGVQPERQLRQLDRERVEVHSVDAALDDEALEA